MFVLLKQQNTEIHPLNELVPLCTLKQFFFFPQLCSKLHPPYLHTHWSGSRRAVSCAQNGQGKWRWTPVDPLLLQHSTGQTLRLLFVKAGSFNSLSIKCVSCLARWGISLSLHDLSTRFHHLNLRCQPAHWPFFCGLFSSSTADLEKV